MCAIVPKTKRMVKCMLLAIVVATSCLEFCFAEGNCYGACPIPSVCEGGICILRIPRPPKKITTPKLIWTFPPTETSETFPPITFPPMEPITFPPITFPTMQPITFPAREAETMVTEKVYTFPPDTEEESTEEETDAPDYKESTDDYYAVDLTTLS
ncbi:unnamed protein product [Acanthoscelides obtectus]|uniref:Uncharacterized protein n=1 Tax=Acanthoscelides obtectus TaxID=200917 RepID=A0A9P0JMH1_ACAOB|nr:unnamed protein product [Acanthoscelides obtectus]CAK1655017.1 hypothetical protein AOBTE_LOCUS18966 [Acanthoscelides obtectus]